MVCNEWSELERLARQREAEARREEVEAERRRQEEKLTAARNEELHQKLRQRITETLNRLVEQWTTPIHEWLDVLALARWGKGFSSFDYSGSYLLPSAYKGTSRADDYDFYTWGVVKYLGGDGDIEKESFTVKLRVWAESASIQSNFTVNDGPVLSTTEDALKKALSYVCRRPMIGFRVRDFCRGEPGGVP
jgi:hypothetical protein